MIETFIKLLKQEGYNFKNQIVIFDIGSRDCQQSIEFFNHFPNAKIFAFECNQNTLQICRKNIINYDRIMLIDRAVNIHDGECTFYPINQKKTVTTWKDGNPGASSLFKSNGSYTVEHYVQDETIVKCNRLDTLMKEFQIEKVDLIWMDLQGAELLALKSLGIYLKDVKYVHTEVSYKEMYTGQVMYEELNEFMLQNGFMIAGNSNRTEWQQDIIYKNKQQNSVSVQIPEQNKYLIPTNQPLVELTFDIVIPLGPKDINQISRQIEHTRNNVIGYRNLYLVSYDSTIQIDGCITIDEKIFPFTIDDVAKYHGKRTRNGWYLQQLIKLYAGFYIPNILDKYLVIDSDAHFLKPITFLNNGKCLYANGIEYHEEYFIHMNKLHSSLNKVNSTKSGICHHMMFEKRFLKSLFGMVESIHNDVFWKIFLEKVTNYGGAGASEYEIYFNYVLKYYPNEIELRQLNWLNTNLNLLDTIKKQNKYDYCACHWHY